MPNKVSLYASVGSELTHYDVDVEHAALTRRATVGLPANVQYVWPNASRRFLYAATSDSASGMGPVGTRPARRVPRSGSSGDGSCSVASRPSAPPWPPADSVR